jgi:hypothetical protein
MFPLQPVREPADWCANERQARPLIVSAEEIGGKDEIAALSCANCFSVLIRVRQQWPRYNVGKYP